MSPDQRQSLIYAKQVRRRDARAQLIEELREGLSSEPKHIPTKCLYDARGSELFEEITTLPEYYLTRTELGILESSALEIAQRARPAEIVELGSGSSRKTQLLIEAMREVGSGERYVPLDVSEDALIGATDRLEELYPWLDVQGVVGEFIEALTVAPRVGARLVTFLGSTIGNLYPNQRIELYSSIAAGLSAQDAFLIGFDLIKDPAVIHAAYNDSKGVTRQFSRNVLVALNRQLGANFQVDQFEHDAIFDPDNRWVRIGLRALSDMVVHLPAANGMRVEVVTDELIHTEISAKFHRLQVIDELRAGGLMLERWFTDPERRFALALVRSRRSARGFLSRSGEF